ncbi:MAG: reactive intermediate/imine deaminase [Flavobacteriales bacterium]|nr:RutC family protein [Flavobacteriales bacterium]MCC6577284.1 reactive intermediate/imine deaminase [Flavobacteriales bacterium]NUQ13725.1 reactive intermediate/imine deaminase [Flavobacteriales bacterium]
MKNTIHLDEKLEGSSPFTAAVEANGFVFISGQIASVKGTRTVLTDNITKEAEQVMANIGEILAAAGLGFDDLVKCTIYLTNLQYYTAVSAVYQACFKGKPPARETVGVKELPRGANVEISGIAVKR